MPSEFDKDGKNRLELIYGLNDRPAPADAVFAAFQHFLAIFVAIITPPLIVSEALSFDIHMKSYLISMSLFVSGISTFIQVKKIGPIGSGLLSIQGTSFTFLTSLIGVGLAAKNAGATAEGVLSTILGVCFIGSFFQMLISRFVHRLKKIITPLVSGIVVTLIGLSLTKVAIIDMGGGKALLNNSPQMFGSMENLLLSFFVVAVVVIFNCSRQKYLRMGAIMIGLFVGSMVCIFLGKVDFSKLSEFNLLVVPVPFKYGFFKFDFLSLLPFSILYLISTMESIGDLTATSMISGEPIKGEKYFRRISGGVLADGFNSGLASIFNSFPNTTFAQNNGIIQMTGIASRNVGYYIAGFLMLVGMFPVVGAVFSLIPSPVFGGASLIMFGTVAASGIKMIASSHIDRRGMLIISVSISLGLGVTFVPELLQHFSPLAREIFGSPITSGGLSAILLNTILPRSEKS
ncbi:MAG: purine permease [Oligoflexales bacterium]|nr:purine permease [Oligoflexales bacterium]